MYIFFMHAFSWIMYKYVKLVNKVSALVNNYLQTIILKPRIRDILIWRTSWCQTVPRPWQNNNITLCFSLFLLTWKQEEKNVMKLFSFSCICFLLFICFFEKGSEDPQPYTSYEETFHSQISLFAVSWDQLLVESTGK